MNDEMAEGPGEGNPPNSAGSNSDRLLQHLDGGTLASQLVQAHKAADDPLKGLKEALAARLEQVRQHVGGRTT